jgi:hypothetical protein
MIGRGLLGLLLTKCGLGHNEANDILDLLEVLCKKQGYKITVEKLDE